MILLSFGISKFLFFFPPYYDHLTHRIITPVHRDHYQSAAPHFFFFRNISSNHLHFIASP